MQKEKSITSCEKSVFDRKQHTHTPPVYDVTWTEIHSEGLENE